MFGARGHFYRGCTLMLSTWGNLEMVGGHEHTLTDQEAASVPNYFDHLYWSVAHYFRNPFGWQGPTYVRPLWTEDVARINSLAHFQRRFGDPPRFELLVAVTRKENRGAGLYHFTRGADPNSWALVDHVAASLEFDGITAISSSFAGNIEVLACSGGKLYFLWHGDHGWSQPVPIGVGSGRAGLTQSIFGRVGNFEVVVPAPEGSDGLLFYWRNNDSTTLPWAGPFTIPGSTGRGGYEDVTLIQSSYDWQLEVLARRREGEYLNKIIDYYWREASPTWTWHGPAPVALPPPGPIF
jgi:hypothetical protein